MSLFGSLQLASNTLQAMQVGLHVVGNNIANANTPGFVREEVVFAPAPVQRKGDLILGLGVKVEGIVQKADRFIQERLRNAASDRTNSEVQEKAYSDLEQVLGELSDTDLSTAFTGFFSSIDNVLTTDSLPNRNLAILQGRSLARDFNSLYSRGEDLHERLNTRVGAISSSINELSEEIRQLNLQISSVEGGGLSGSEAGGLRTQRSNAIGALAELVDIRVNEQPSGAVTVSVGGEFLVVDGIRREVASSNGKTDGLNTATVQFADLNSPLQIAGGELQGLYTARDEIIGGFISDINALAKTLSFEFNKLYSQGQGAEGFESVTSTNQVVDFNAPLDEAGLEFTPVNGAFDVIVRNTNTGEAQTHTIRIDLNGLDDDTSLTDLTAELEAIPGLTASISPSGNLTIASDTVDTDFAFSGDNSGALAALGINTFFTGSEASDLSVNSELDGIENAAKFAASLGGIGEDLTNTERLAEFYTRNLESEGDVSLSDKYTQLTNGVAQGSTVARAVADGFRVFEATLDGENQALSAVNIDEEAVRMITLQRSYQASARYIQTISELLDTLVSL